MEKKMKNSLSGAIKGGDTVRGSQAVNGSMGLVIILKDSLLLLPVKLI